MAGPLEGKTATNKATGEKIIFQGGQWRPVGANGVAVSAEDRTAAQKQIAEAKEQARRGEAQTRGLDRFSELNQQTPTGPVYGVPFAPEVAGALAKLPILKNMMGERAGENLAEMKAIGERMIPLARPPGSGTMSDADVRMFRASGPGVDKWGGANQGITKEMRSNTKDWQDYAVFLEQYAAAHGGSITGAEKEWQARVAKNGAAKRPQTKRLRFNPETQELE